MGKQVSSRQAIREITKRGWVKKSHKGTSHVKFKHPANPLLIVIPHPTKSLSPGVVRDIERKAGFRF